VTETEKLALESPASAVRVDDDDEMLKSWAGGGGETIVLLPPHPAKHNATSDIARAT
jgi:hypothetical protein